MESSASRTQILGCMVGLSSRCVTRFAKVRDTEGLDNLSQCVGLANASTSKPYSSVVVLGCGHWEQMRTFVRPGIEAFLQVSRYESYSVNLLLGAVRICDKLPSYTPMQK